MPSFAARMLAGGVRAAGMKRRLFDPAQFSKPRGPLPHRPPRWLGRGVTASGRDFQGWPVQTVTPPGPRGTARILYLHGGAYAHPMQPTHWLFVGRLARATGRPVIVPRYPLTPEHTHRDVFATLIALYRELVADAGGGQVAVAGDSAGGGMALALAQSLPDGVPQPTDLVLFCPWLDATLADAAVPAIDPHDPLLNPEHLRAIGVMYAGADDPSHPAVSPLNGRFAGLGRITVFSGTRDVLSPDARTLRTRAVADGVAVDLHEYDGMIHDWMLVPIPEARDVLARVAGRLA